MKKIIFLLVFYYSLFISHYSFSQNGWFFQNSGFSITGALTDVFFINPNTGWICGQFEMISKTTNGGINWIPIQNAGYHHYAIYFINNNTGWVATTENSSYVLLKTTNFGENWISLNILNQYPSDIFFINENTGWISSENSKILKTTNGGLSWSIFNVQSAYPYWFFTLSFINSQIGWSAGSYTDTYNSITYFAVIKTTDGGDNWSFIRQEISPPSRNYRDIQFLNEQTGYLNRIPPSKTTDGGLSWFNILDSTYYMGMRFVNENTGWFVGWGGIQTKTTNGGLNWQTNIMINQFVSQEVFSINQNIGWMVGMTYISQNVVYWFNGKWTQVLI